MTAAATPALARLSDPALLRTQLYVGGAWTAGSGGETAPVTDPATGATLADVAEGTREDAKRAIDAAAAALPVWSGKTAKERAGLMRRWYELIVEHADDLAVLLTAEQGKPLAEARGEILYGAGFVEWYAEEGKRAYGDVIPTNDAGRRLFAIRQPVGVCAAITPWNFPMAMIARKVAPALGPAARSSSSPPPRRRSQRSRWRSWPTAPGSPPVC